MQNRSEPVHRAAASIDGQDKSQGLSGLVIVEMSDSPGACFAGSLLADFGAAVFICEALPNGSRMRSIGAGSVGDPWWRTLSRNKKSIAVDPVASDARKVVRSLVSHADLVIADAGPRNRNTHPFLSLIEGFSEVLVLDVFATGKDMPELWPWSFRPELAAAATGMMALTGWGDKTPVQPEVPLVEYLAGTMAAVRALAELRHRRLGEAAPTDILVPLHQAVHRMNEWQVAVATALHRPELRDGNEFPLSAGVSNMHRTQDGKYIAISAASQAAARRLLEMVGGDRLRDDPRFSTVEARAEQMKSLYAILDDWVGAHSADQVLDAAARHDVVLGLVYSTGDIVADPQVRARENICEAIGQDGVTMRMPGIVPRISGLETNVRNLGPDLGQNTEEILELVGFAAEEIRQFMISKTIAVTTCCSGARSAS